MTTTIENYCIDCRAVAQPDCESRGHLVGTLGQADSDSDTERDADYDNEQERIKFQKELGAAMVKAGAREIELPRITYRCPNCGQVDSHTDECPSNPQRYEHDAPAAPERGDQPKLIDQLLDAAIYAADIDRRVAARVRIVKMFDQHSTLSAQRERLIDLLKQTRAFICEATWTETKPRKREAEGLVAQIDAVITTSEQEGRTER